MARSIHSVPVMRIALLPAFGAIAYVASETMVKKGLGRLLVDQSAYKMPFGLYRRLGLARFTAPRLHGWHSWPPADQAKGSHLAVPSSRL